MYALKLSGKQNKKPPNKKYRPRTFKEGKDSIINFNDFITKKNFYFVILSLNFYNLI